MINECFTAVSVQKSLKVTNNLKISANTIRRALMRNGFEFRVKRKKPLLSKMHQEKWLKFAKKYKDWTLDD